MLVAGCPKTWGGVPFGFRHKRWGAQNMGWVGVWVGPETLSKSSRQTLHLQSLWWMKQQPLESLQLTKLQRTSQVVGVGYPKRMPHLMVVFVLYWAEADAFLIISSEIGAFATPVPSWAFSRIAFGFKRNLWTDPNLHGQTA